MNTLSTQETAAYFKAHGLTLTSADIAQLAKNGGFPNAQKDSQNRWQIPEDDINSYIALQKGKRKFKFGITVGTIVSIVTILTIISVFKDGLDTYFNYVEPIFASPKVEASVLHQELLSGIREPLICRSTIKLDNISKVSTSLITVGIEFYLDNVLFSSNPTNNVLSWSNGTYEFELKVWNNNPSAMKDFPTPTMYQHLGTLTPLEESNSHEEIDLPIQISAYSTIEIVINLIIKSDFNSPSNIMVAYLLNFENIDDIKTNSAICKYRD